MYIVQRGDTLSHIAKTKLGCATRWPEIAKLNHLLNPNYIFVGQKLWLPLSGTMGTVRSTGILQMASGQGVTPTMPANIALARGFLFVVFEQLPNIGSEKIIRKVAAIPRDFSLSPKNYLGTLSPAEHALGLNPLESQFLSASDRPFGAPNFKGKPLLLDVAKIKQAGGEVYSVIDVVNDLKRFSQQNPSSSFRVDKLIKAIRNIEGEVLIKGGAPANAAKTIGTLHLNYIRSAEDLWTDFNVNRINKAQLEQELASLSKAYSKARIMGNIGRVLLVGGLVITAAELTMATSQSIEQKSLKPISAEVIRQAGGWGFAYAGGKIGFATGALFGIETGPGAIITGVVGAIVFGAAGYFGADWVADMISPN